MEENKQKDLVLVAGVSGAGRSTALHRFEDLGFLTMENLPPVIFSAVLEELKKSLANYRYVAVTVKTDSDRDLEFLLDQLEKEHTQPLNVHIVFLDSSTDSIVNRYSETRRPHPKFDSATDSSLSDTVARERQRLQGLKNRSHLVLDTTSMSIHDLRREILSFAETLQSDLTAKMRVNIQSFGFKYGSPRDCDILMDVRFLDNPYFNPELRPLTGLDERVSEHVLTSVDAQEFLARYSDLLKFLIPRYQFEGKAYLNVGVGCTGGQHRSVAIAEALGGALRPLDVNLSIRHRDLSIKNGIKS